MPIPESPWLPSGSPSGLSPAALPLDMFPQAITLVDGQGRILQANAEAMHLLGLVAPGAEPPSLEDPHWKLIRADGSPVPAGDLPGPRALREGRRIDETELGVLRPDGEVAWLRMTAVPLGPDLALLTHGDVSSFRRSRDIQAAASRLAEQAPGLSLELLLRATLDEAELLTGSCIGFYHFVKEDQETLQLQAWSTRTEATYCRAEGKGLHYPVSQAGVWADCLRTGQPLIHNDYASLPNRRGLPEGHAALVRELTVPVHRAGRVVALLGVGNKATNYHESDVDTVHRLADLAWHLAESKRVTLALEASLATNQALIQAIPDLIFMNRQDGECLAVHGPVQGLLGLPPETFLHRKLQEVLPRRLAVQMLGAFAEALGAGAAQELTCLAPIAGEERQFEARVVPCAPDTVLTIVRDITQRKRAEEALRESERLLRESQEIAQLGSYVMDLATGCFQTSPALDAILGIDDQYLRSVEGWTALIHPDWAQPMKDHLFQEVLGNRQPFDKEYKIVRRGTGEERWVHGLGRLEFDPFGVPKKLIGTLRDITEPKRAEAEKAQLQEQLQQAQKMESLGTLAGGIAHDMNNVLGAILGLASAHLEVQPPGTPGHRAFETIARAAVRGGDMVKRLLAFARQGQAEERELDVNALLQEQIRLLEHTTLAKVRLELDLAEGLRAMRGDAGALAHAFMNLCVNAVDAMPDQGTLSLRTRNVDNHWIEVRVEDTGTGMPQAVLDRALEPFYTTKGLGKGTGLGLAMVYRTVQAHRGQMELRSQPGRGTQVRLRFPAFEPLAEGASAVSQVTTEPARSPLSVLLVDDDELMANSMQVLLQSLGHTVLTSASGEEGLAALEAGFEPDVVILDINMPGLGGSGTLPRLRALRPGLPVLLSTGRADQAALDLAKAYPAVALLAKPFSLRELQGCLEALGPD